ncbi:DUF397 domain-containing protein [Nocardia sp. NBC_01730]|uniref:DUF397 domain-containing protein n=1 Tax=Nocardia sp. NBC_01730 TaxID=2975998 RepID=UPI002E0FB6FF|nr:DUF397 domain-containing protein [Nocardia sp. NBC_01730]
MSTADHLSWRTSSYSGNGEGCVDVAPATDSVFVRPVKHRDQGIIEFTAAQWSTCVRAARVGLAGTNGAAVVRQNGADTLVTSPGVQLRFDETEWTAFLAGANDGEFDS